MKEVIIGPFQSFAWLPWKQRIRFFKDYTSGRLLDEEPHVTKVDLNPKRIKAVYVAGKGEEERYIIRYVTDYPDYYGRFKCELPPDARELDKLKGLVCSACGTGVVSFADGLACYNPKCNGSYLEGDAFEEKILWSKEMFKQDSSTGVNTIILGPLDGWYYSERTGRICFEVPYGYRLKSGLKRRLYLDPKRIEGIYRDKKLMYYILYRTSNADYYKNYPHVDKVPEGVKEVRKLHVERCSLCKGKLDWDADEPYCPRGCHNDPNWSFYSETIWKKPSPKTSKKARDREIQKISYLRPLPEPAE